MGVQPFLITATLEAVVAQRLLRTICPDCRESYVPDEEVLLELGSDGERLRGSTFYYGKGCASCHHTGYRGRTGVFEIMTIDADLRQAVLDGASIEEVRTAAIANGMRTLRESAMEAVSAGRTTIEELLRETMV
jgi:type IV pilus assembly protein PilB